MSPVEDPDDFPRVAEVVRLLGDFRSEVRGMFSQMVRSDVYAAEQAAIRDRLTRTEAIVNAAGNIDQRIQELSAAVRAIESTRSANRNATLIAILGAALSLALWVIQNVAQG